MNACCKFLEGTHEWHHQLSGLQGADWSFSIGQGLRCRKKKTTFCYNVAVTQASQVAPPTFAHGGVPRSSTRLHNCVNSVKRRKLESRKCTIDSTTVENNYCKNSVCFTTTNLKEKPSREREATESLVCPLSVLWKRWLQRQLSSELI